MNRSILESFDHVCKDRLVKYLLLVSLLDMSYGILCEGGTCSVPDEGG